MTATLDIRVERASGVVALYLAGDVCHLTVPALRRQLDEAIAVGTGRVVIDLGGVALLGAAGLTELARAAVALQRDGRVLRLRRPTGLVRRALDIAGFATLLEDRALASTN